MGLRPWVEWHKRDHLIIACDQEEEEEEEEKLGLWPSPGSLQMLNVNFDLDKRQSFPLEIQETNPKVMP
jgi:hypothetical protein